ncbi:MAG: hypothetical protein ND895_26175 [Pyrinomonadaceae bacterium]|nr:hypothetical protein [Pyrinomonadaceae bacterium]
MGVWKYPERSVWIQILPDGRSFQCRIAPEGTVITSEGVFIGGQIEWRKIWGTDTITRNKTSITLCGKYGVSTLVQTQSEMDSACKSPFENTPPNKPLRLTAR